jgi:hypothetical protein
MQRRVALLRTDVSDELNASIIRVKRSSSETSVLNKSHTITSQKTPFFIVTAVKTSNLPGGLTVSQYIAK